MPAQSTDMDVRKITPDANLSSELSLPTGLMIKKFDVFCTFRFVCAFILWNAARAQDDAVLPPFCGNMHSNVPIRFIHLLSKGTTSNDMLLKLVLSFNSYFRSVKLPRIEKREPHYVPRNVSVNEIFSFIC